mgnify:CR=1 FL=1
MLLPSNLGAPGGSAGGESGGGSRGLGGGDAGADLQAVEESAIPGAGSCGGMYTANTMASAIEALGMSLPNSSAQTAVGEDKMRDCFDAGAAVLMMLLNVDSAMIQSDHQRKLDGTVLLYLHYNI